MGERTEARGWRFPLQCPRGAGGLHGRMDAGSETMDTEPSMLPTIQGRNHEREKSIRLGADAFVHRK